MNVKKVFTVVGLLVIAVFTLWIIYFFYQRHVYVITDNAFERADVVDVSVQDVSGKITKLLKKEFAPVKKGELLFTVDDSIYRKDLQSLESQISAMELKKKSLEVKLSRVKQQLPLEVKIKERQLSVAEKELKKLYLAEKMAEVDYKTSVAQAKAAVEASEKALLSAQTNLSFWKNRYNRYKRLYGKRVISKEQFEEIENGYKKAIALFASAESKLKSAKENLKKAESLKSRVEQIKVSIKEAKKRVDEAKLAVSLAREDLKKIQELENSIKELEKNISALKEKKAKVENLISYCYVKSPVKGVIAKKWKEVGDFVSPGLPVYSIYSPESFYVLAWIEEDKIPYVKVGANVKAELEVCGKTFEGKVTSVGTSAGSIFALIPRDTSQGEFTRVTQRVPVKIKLENVPLKCIKPGTNVTVYIRKE
ncbi:membrane fusion protein, multidrug efflux system [Desulfurobacterium pacificum]|uniref:Membrane fusion protein, multidrug efflux system n=1 Tax=Desulfurobacterium pacificum TaxID=240166 RepID=A0ABY1NAS8_9BACT|nr:HlyD family efflux transporter periplasmic adaptor subunit [Desulfurobacterium pacificum]SMP04790.1 membrane fusion protein, multidrug efflux system [Desulfurobacterium pacificum]